MSIRPTVIIIFPLECWRYMILLLWNHLQSFLTVVLIKVCFLISAKNQIYVLFIKMTYKLLIITDYCHYYQFVGIFNSLYKYLEDSKLLSVHQSDFGSSDSCVNQLLSVVHKLFEAFHAYPHLETCVVFHDMFKAFDKVWHQGLIFKLKSVRVSDSLLCLLESFLSNIFQRVLLMARHLTGYQLRLVCH